MRESNYLAEPIPRPMVLQISRGVGSGASAINCCYPALISF